ncbi:MAG TPA: lysylphosphatidylglycerol synthase transmembrane domain-containing protein [Longimicrobiales bacterium]
MQTRSETPATIGGALRSAWRSTALRVSVSAALLVLLFRLLPLDDVWGALTGVGATLWLAAIAAYLSAHLLGVVKWRLLVNTAGAALPRMDAVRCYYLGLFGNTFLPSVVGGDLIRAGAALRRVRSREALVLGSLVDRVQDMLALAAVAGIGALLLPTALDDRSRRVFGMFALAGIAFGGIVLLALRLLPGRRFPLRFRRRLVRIRAAYRALSRRPRALIGAVLLGMLLQLAMIALSAWLGSLVGLVVPFQVWLFVWPLAKIAATVPLTQGGLGVREAALAALFAPFGVEPALAVTASLAFQFALISGGLTGGVLYVLMGRMRGATGTAAAPVMTPGSLTRPHARL